MRKIRIAAIFASASLLLWSANKYKSDPPRRVNAIFNDVSNGTEQYRASHLRPEQKQGLWKISVGTWEVEAGGNHMFLEFSPADKTDGSSKNIFQIHGISIDTAKNHTSDLNFSDPAFIWSYMTGQQILKVTGVHHDFNKLFFHKTPSKIVDVLYGSRDQVLKLYLDALSLARQINEQNYSYELLNRNSNSVARSLLEGMGLGVPSIFCSTREEIENEHCIWTPAIGENLVPDDWSRGAARYKGGYAHLSGDTLLEKAIEKSIPVSETLLRPRHADNDDTPPPFKSYSKY